MDAWACRRQPRRVLALLSSELAVLTDSGAPPSLYAVRLTGEPRLVSRLTGSMKLFDISGAGRVLLSNGTWRAALLWQPPGEVTERDMSWLDWSIAADLSPDGRTVLFNETREGGGARNAVYLRRADAPSPIRIRSSRISTTWRRIRTSRA